MRMSKRKSSLFLLIFLFISQGFVSVLAQGISPSPDLSDILADPVPVVLPRAGSGHDGVVEADVVDDPLIPFRPGAGEVVEVDVIGAGVPVLNVVPGVPVANDMTRVSVLGYHDFGAKNPTEMKMRTSDFRAQMQRVKNSGATVISLEDFLAWKSGAKQLPAHCILITLDDGWKSVYTDAYPILKEYGFPFTLFLYTRYVNSGGASLSWEMIKEMMKNGASIGSHSVTHPYPKDYRREKRKGEESFIKFLKKEVGESKKVLEENLGVVVEAYCYPGGYKTQEMFDVLAEEGYKAAFDVLPGKVVANTKDLDLPRYMVLGDKLGTFEGSLAFETSRPGSAVAPQSGRPTGSVPSQVVAPRANSLLTMDLHPIAIDLSNEGNIDPSSINMRVSGVGRVMGKYDPASKTYSWKPNRLLRGTVTVQVSWHRIGSRSNVAPVVWQFKTTEFAEEPPPAGWIP